MIDPFVSNSIVSGQWSPTVSGLAGAASVTIQKATYIMVNNVVSISLVLLYTKNASTVDFTIDLPTAIEPSTNWAGNAEASGFAITVDDAEYISGIIFSKISSKNMRLLIKYTGTTGTACQMGAGVQYLRP